MKILTELLILISIQHTARALLTCQQVNVDECLKPFKEDFDAGVESLKQAGEETTAQACWKYQLISKCLVPIVFYCPEIKSNLQTKLEDFEYFCADISHKSDDGWPLKPTFKSDDSEKEELIKEAEDSLKRKRTIDSAINVMIAAAVTVFLILICASIECISKCKKRRKAKSDPAQKAEASSAAVQADQQQKEKLLQKGTRGVDEVDDCIVVASPEKV